jgi:outer membrane lipoprotein-sorting protein
MKLMQLAVALLVGFCAVCVAQEPDFMQILAEIDELSNFTDTDFSAVYTIIAERPGEERDAIQARLFRRDENEQFVIIILQPEIQRGQGYLQIDENVWFYDPESRKFERTAAGETIQNSDAQNADFDSSSFLADYDVEAWQEGTLGDYRVYIVDLHAKTSDVVYDRTRLWIHVDVSIVLKKEDYSVNKRLMRTLFFPRYERVGTKLIPNQILIIDELNEGERTQITMSNATIQDIPDSVFSKTYLERVGK